MALEGATLSLPEGSAASGEVLTATETAAEGGAQLLDMLDQFEAGGSGDTEWHPAPTTTEQEGGEGGLEEEEAMLEEKFQHRYTEEDPGFQATRQKPLPPPPCVKDWFVRRGRDNWRGRGGGGGGGFRGNYRGQGGRGGGWQQDRGYSRGYQDHSQQHWGGRGGYQGGYQDRRRWGEDQGRGGNSSQGRDRREGGWGERQRDRQEDWGGRGRPRDRYGDRERWQSHGHSQSDRRDRSPL